MNNDNRRDNRKKHQTPRREDNQRRANKSARRASPKSPFTERPPPQSHTASKYARSSPSNTKEIKDIWGKRTNYFIPENREHLKRKLNDLIEELIQRKYDLEQDDEVRLTALKRLSDESHKLTSINIESISAKEAEELLIEISKQYNDIIDDDEGDIDDLKQGIVQNRQELENTSKHLENELERIKQLNQALGRDENEIVEHVGDRKMTKYVRSK